MKSISLSVSYNYFGNTVISDGERDYNMFQYNGRNARELLNIIKDFISSGYSVFVIEDNEFLGINITPALPYIQRIVDLIEDVDRIRDENPDAFHNDCAGAEIAGRYGY